MDTVFYPGTYAIVTGVMSSSSLSQLKTVNSEFTLICCFADFSFSMETNNMGQSASSNSNMRSEDMM